MCLDTRWPWEVGLVQLDVGKSHIPSFPMPRAACRWPCVLARSSAAVDEEDDQDFDEVERQFLIGFGQQSLDDPSLDFFNFFSVIECMSLFHEEGVDDIGEVIAHGCLIETCC